MKIKQTSLILLLLLIFLTYSIAFPSFFNRGVGFLNRNLPIEIPEIKDREFMFGLDLQGGAYLLYEADLSDIPSGERIQRMDGLRDLIERRIDIFGVAESSVQVRGERLTVEIPGAHELEDAINIIGETPFLDFREFSSEVLEKQEKKLEEVAEYLDKEKENITYEDILMIEDGRIDNIEVIFESPYKRTELTGRHLKSASAVISPLTQEPIIMLSFDEEGAELFAEITERNVGNTLATFLDNQILQEATVQEKISGGEAQITGSFSVEEAYDVARDLRIGSLPVPINLISQQSIGPTLGEESLSSALRAGIIGFILVTIFMIAIYRLPGLFAMLSLGSYIIFVIFLFNIVPVTLTLSGIAGFILSVGMAIDANILIISRMREEIRSGKEIKESIENGYKRAWASIRDGNITTLMVAIVLFFITTSFVRGFAITLILGILVSLFCAIIVSRVFFALFEEGTISKRKNIWL